MDTTTALTLVFPEETHQKINEIRSKYDKAYPRWAPHINFIFPFVPVEKFDEIHKRLSVLNNFGSFALNMNQIGYFTQGADTTFHLKPENDANLQKLFDAIKTILPEVTIKHAKFTPHLTLAQFPTSQLNQRKSELESWLGNGIKIIVDKIHLINRTGILPFKINREVPLCQTIIQGSMKTAAPRMINKSVEKVKFSQANMATFIDNSGSIAGKILQQEISLASALFFPKEFINHAVFWNTGVKVRPTQIGSTGGTSPKCIFDNAESKKMFADCDVVLFMTDGEIEPNEVTEFSNRLKNYLNKYLFICVFVSNKRINFNEFNVSVMAPMMVGPNVLCLYYDVNCQNFYVLASKGEIARKYPGPTKLELTCMSTFDIKDLSNIEISKTNVPANCLVIEETTDQYMVVDLNDVDKCDILIDITARAWEVLIRHAVVAGTLDKIRGLVSKTRNHEIMIEKQKCQTDFSFDYITKREDLTDQMAKAYSENDTERQKTYKLLLDEIRDEVRKEELAYTEFVKKRLDMVRGKWEFVRNILHNFESTDSKFSLNNFVFGSNRANRAKTVDEDLGDLDERLTFDTSPEIECVVHMDNGPAVLWLNKSDDMEYAASDFCINFPLAHYPALQNIFVNNPVCGDCAKHYLKYAKTSVYRQPLTTFIPVNWDTTINISYAQNVLYRVLCGNKQLHHVKMLLLSLLDDNIDKWMLSYRDEMIKSLITNIYTNDTLTEEGTKVPFIKMLSKITTDEENFLRQPFTACTRILMFCQKYLNLDKNIICGLVRKRFAYLMVEIYANYTKKTPIDTARSELESICFDTICGIPIENTVKLCSIDNKQLVDFIKDPVIGAFLERVAECMKMSTNGLINSKTITNILWHLQLLTTHERPWTIYTNLMKQHKLFRSIGEEPNNLTELINNERFGKYKNYIASYIPGYAYYNGEYSAPSKLYFADQPLWSRENNGSTMTIATLAGVVCERMQKSLSETYGSNYPNSTSAHFMLHRTVAKVLERPHFKNINTICDQMILDCLLTLAESNGNYGNIYRAKVLEMIICTIKNFCEVRSKCTNYSTGNENLDKTGDHKIKCELLTNGIKIQDDTFVFEANKLKPPKNIMQPIPDILEIKARIEKLYIEQKSNPIVATTDKIVSYYLPETIVIGDANVNIKDCMTGWEKEQLEVVNKISLVDDAVLNTNKFYIAGADISWDKDDTTNAVGSMVIHEYPSLKVLCQVSVRCKLNIPYQAGFLAFREVPIYLKLIDALYQSYPEYIPNLVLIDGNGVWHPRGCGAASHFSVLSGIPAIGVSKNVLFTDGMGKDEVQNLLEANATNKDEFVKIIGRSGKMLGYAYNSSGSVKKAIYISAGHMISHEKAVEIVRAINRYRVTEVIRQADKLSRMLAAE